MAISQPVAGDKLNSPDHSLMHRQIATDPSAPVLSLTISSVGNIGGTCLQNTNPTNLLSNGDFESWSAGTAVAPDGWSLTGAGASVAREGTIIKLGTYSIKVTRGGTDCYVLQDISTARGIAYWKGRKVTFGCWVYATVADRARVLIYDNVGTNTSSYHTGDSTWQWLSVTRTIDASATYVDPLLYVDTGDTDAYFDGAMCVEGESAFAYSPKPVSWIGGTVNPTNLLSNGDFENWSAGTAVAPDGWVLAGASATVAREGTIIKLGTYSAKVTRAGTNCYLYPAAYETPPKGVVYYRGRKVTAGCWVYATVADRARIVIQDGVSSSVNSSYHTGDSTWQWLSVTATIASNATQLYLACEVNTGDTDAYFDGAMLVEGESAFAFSDKPAGEGVWADYGGTSTITGWASFTSQNIFVKKVGKLVFVNFLLAGTSNSTAVNFTLPYSNQAGVRVDNLFVASDNGGASVVGHLNLPVSVNDADLFATVADGAWTNSGTKLCLGQFFYESA